MEARPIRAEALYRGEGRGPITNDGCAVELYRVLPYRDEVARFHHLLPRGGTILELGCGTGRVTRALLDSGHEVTAVDNSPEMLRHVPHEAQKVLAQIEDLELGRRFDVALLGSCLINTPVDEVRRAQLCACRRHLKPGGRLVFERFDPSWLRSAEAGQVGHLGDVTVTVEHVARDAERVSVSLRYSTAAEDWRQHFTAVVLDDDAVQRALAASGFGAVTWLDSRWGVAHG